MRKREREKERERGERKREKERERERRETESERERERREGGDGDREMLRVGQTRLSEYGGESDTGCWIPEVRCGTQSHDTTARRHILARKKYFVMAIVIFYYAVFEAILLSISCIACFHALQ